ncbi:ABC transporter ATP-binding protein (plasmid) [Phyllobacterium sp. A18/5-2]|uniref:ABC transporter ATP-binding protein n=1 Tax=Phyllobacterium sp. A18/5-2 TaxID=2978392 RepID=UPI000DDD6FE4|nr:ABC transporter ATP-binding protein [Phyllobacterium sp. A18/5-2]UXN66645.1 ABC transporter ATP-binding protein [Phyllobacterium sp. A18/5-2]
MKPDGAYIHIDRASKKFATRSGEQVLALSEVNLSIDKGKFITLVGPSGCGKSTLLRIIGGLLSRSSGRVSIGGEEIDAPTDGVGMVFQSPVLLPWRTVLDNVTIAADLGRANRDLVNERALRFLKMVGLSGFENKYPGELSGGMQQRVGITRALVHDPDVLLMDEPFAALDALTRDRLQVELQALWMASQKTVIFVTHSIQEAVFLADRVVVLAPRPGRVVDDIAIDLPRPRTLEMVNSKVFGDYSNAVRRHFDAEETVQ